MVFDEADCILDGGNIELMAEFCRIVVNEGTIESRGFAARLFLVSATLNNTLKEFVEGLFGSDESKQKNFKYLIDKGTHLNLAHVQHEFIKLTEFDKHQQFLDLVDTVNADLKAADSQMKTPERAGKSATCMIFCNTIGSCRSTEFLLKKKGFDSMSMHGDVPAKVRVQNYHRFNNGEVKYAVCTDIGSRGLDFKNVKYVLNFDFP
jgi:superfamily II DNA/RNA helicase